LCIIDAKAFRHMCTFSEVMVKVNKMLSDIFLQIQTSLLKYTKINVLGIKLHILYYCKNNNCRQRMQFQNIKIASNLTNRTKFGQEQSLIVTFHIHCNVKANTYKRYV